MREGDSFGIIFFLRQRATRQKLAHKHRPFADPARGERLLVKHPELRAVERRTHRRITLRRDFGRRGRRAAALELLSHTEECHG